MNRATTTLSLRNTLAVVAGFVAMVTGVSAQTCPPLVHPPFAVIWKTPSELPHDGWMCYVGDNDKSYVSRIKNHAPVAVTNAGGTQIHFKRPTFTADGKWIVGANMSNSGKLAVYNIAVAKLSELDIVVGELVCVNYNSPYERPWDGIWEIAYLSTDKKEAFAQILDLSNLSAPTLGTKRKIATGMQQCAGDFSVVSDLIVWDWGPSYLLTIPENGLGIADGNSLYGVSVGSYSCAVSISGSGRYWSQNSNVKGGCTWGTHDGFVVMQTKRAGDPVVSANDWMFNPDKGAVSVCGVPDSIDGYWQHNPDADNAWFGWRFLNDEDYVAGFHIPTATPNKGGYIVKHREGVWYEVVPRTSNAKFIAAWFDDVAMPGRSPESPVKVVIASPVRNTVFQTGVNVTITASAFSTNGPITRFVILDNGTAIGTVNAPECSYVIAGIQEGIHALVVRAFDASGDSSQAVVGITAEDEPMFSSIRITPENSAAAPGVPMTFTGAALDQYGRVMGSTSVSPVWTAPDGAGSFNAAGVLTPKAEGDFAWYTVRAEYQGKSGQTRVLLPRTVPLAAGPLKEMLVMKSLKDTSVWKLSRLSSAQSATGNSWAYFDTTDPWHGTRFAWLDPTYFTWAIASDTDGVWFTQSKACDVGPQWSNMCAFTLATAVTMDAYIRYSSAGAVQSVAVNGKSYGDAASTGSAYDTIGPFALVPGLNHFVIRTGAVSKSRVEISLVDMDGNALSGVNYTLLQDPGVIAQGYRILSPGAGDKIHVGDTVVIRWLASGDITQTDVEYSVNAGKTWFMGSAQSVLRTSSEWGATPWIVPESAPDATALAGVSVVFRVKEYGVSSEWSATSSAVPIVASSRVSPTTIMAHGRARLLGVTSSGIVIAAGAQNADIQIHDLRGRLVASVKASSGTVVKVPLRGLTCGQYLLSVKISQGTVIRQVVSVVRNQ